MNPEVREYFDLIKKYLSEKYSFEEISYDVTDAGFRLDLRLTPEQAETLEGKRARLGELARRAAWFAADQLRVPMEQVNRVGFQYEDGILTLVGAPTVLTALLLQILDEEP